jgi:hypothetical protein
MLQIVTGLEWSSLLDRTGHMKVIHLLSESFAAFLLRSP